MKAWLNAIGSVLAILVMGAVLHFYGADLANLNLAKPGLPAGIASAVALYTVVVLMGAASWAIILRSLGMDAPWAASVKILMVTQIGKYLPGNVAQYVGRAGMTIGAGGSAKLVGLALLLEAVAIMTGGLVAIGIALFLSPDVMARLLHTLPEGSMRLPIVGVTCALALVVAVSLATTHLPRFQGLPQLRLGGLVAAIVICTISFGVLGASIEPLAAVLSTRSLPTTAAIAVFAAAWIAGLVTPGAPGGLGVRESILTVGLASYIGGSTALALALIYRGVSVLGDVVSLAVGIAIPVDHTEIGAPASKFDGRNEGV